jgi:putative tryptophan/tyrosine transport system substrate-binding protein
VRRRQFITLVGGAAAWPLKAQAQGPTQSIIGMLATSLADLRPKSAEAFRQGLRETGYVEGQNLIIERRGAGGRYDELPKLCDELLRIGASLLVTGGVPATMAAKASGTNIPVVFYMGGDPVELGLVASMSDPASNFSGVTLLSAELGPKRLELLRELLPAVGTFGLLVNPTNRTADPQWRDMQAAASILNLKLERLEASSAAEFEAVFQVASRWNVGGIAIAADGLFVSQSERLGELSVRHGLPAIFQFPEFALSGGLASYGGSLTDAYRQVGIYAGKILKGARPSELPIQQVAKVEMTINLKTAKALKINIPLPLLGRADDVIE